MHPLDELLEKYPCGTRFRVGENIWVVHGVVWSLPKQPGGPDTPALVCQNWEYPERIGHVFEEEIEAVDRP